MPGSKVQISVPNQAVVRDVASRMRERDLAEFLAVSPLNDREGLAEILAARYGDHPDAFLVTGDDGPVAVGALVQHRPRVVTLMFFATDDFPSVAHALTRFICKTLFPEYRRQGVHRIECVSIAGYAETHRWIKALGLTEEGQFQKYGRDGQSFVQFAWVAP